MCHCGTAAQFFLRCECEENRAQPASARVLIDIADPLSILPLQWAMGHHWLIISH